MNLKCSNWEKPQKLQNDLGSFPREAIQHHGNPSLCPTVDAEEVDVDQFNKDLEDLLELTPKKMYTSLGIGMQK